MAPPAPGPAASPSPLLGYGVAGLSVLIAWALTAALWPLIAPGATPIFIAAVVVSSWYAGLRAGLVATVLAAAISEAVYFPPLSSVDIATFVRACAFTFVAVLVASLHEKARAAQARAEDLARAREALLRQEQAARADAETASRAKDAFLATLSHELRTPLNAMVGWLWWLRTGMLDEAKRERALDTIERNTKSLAQLIEDLLDVSRIITGKLRLDIRTAPLVPVIEAAVEAVAPAASAKSIALDVALDPAVGPVLGDPDRLQQIMWNLLSNAIKFTPEKGRVHVRLAPRDGAAEIVVRDTGRGIPPDLLPHVFDRFRQAETSARFSHGLGLGLSIVRDLVLAHGGTITAESAGEGFGSSFVVTLPVPSQVADDLAAASLPPARTVPGPSTARSLAGLRVLVVEDDVEARRSLTGILEHFGATVTPAGSMREAIVAMEAEPPDILVSDIRLPGEDGYALIREVRAREARSGRHTPAVALTAYPRVEDRRRALEAGYEMHVPKPVEPAALAGVIASLAGRPAEDAA
jgi:signal transduction histidine kinase/CheY-like chemotaxis protein